MRAEAASSGGCRASEGTGDEPARADVDAVTQLLGRPPRSRWRVAVRCPHGTPAVVENDPLDRDGNPFPTRYWLVCRALSASVARLEAAGGVKALESDPSGAATLADAHRRHRALTGAGVAGTVDPARAKCLHAHLAFALADDDTSMLEWIGARADLAFPEGCCLDDGRAESP